MWAKNGATIGETMNCDGALYEKLWRPVMLSALNTEPREASATLAGAVLRETLAAGGAACRPLVAKRGLGDAFIEPALRALHAKGVEPRFGARLREIVFRRARVRALRFGDEEFALSESDSVVLGGAALDRAGASAGSRRAGRFSRHSQRPFQDRAARRAAAAARHDRLALRMAFRLRRPAVRHDQRRRPVDGRAARGAGGKNLGEKSPPHPVFAGTCLALPPWQIVKEKRATFAATPAQEARRPGAATSWPNLFLAGDWTNTGLPATIEGSIRSGYRAAELAGA